MYVFPCVHACVSVCVCVCVVFLTLFKLHPFFLAVLKDEVGLIAVNDAFVLEGMVFTILEKHLKDHPAYVKIMELFHQVRVSRYSSIVCIG